MKTRPLNSRLYPWYDSVWLEHYTSAKQIIRNVKPTALDAFESAMRPLRTHPEFRVKVLDRVIDDVTLEKIRHIVKALRPMDFELHEARQFKRFIVHDHPYFTELQRQLTALMSDAVNEPVEPCYNFLSLYTAAGVCPVHMDSPEAKWTLDICLNQSEPWPLWISDVQPWPEATPDVALPWWHGDDWEQSIKQSPTANFTAHTMQPGQGIVFSGSSQWHYRDAMPAGSVASHCDLLFFHFVPAGTAELVRPANWARWFDIPELARESDATPDVLVPTANA